MKGVKKRNVESCLSSKLSSLIMPSYCTLDGKPWRNAHGFFKTVDLCKFAREYLPYRVTCTVKFTIMDLKMCDNNSNTIIHCITQPNIVQHTLCTYMRGYPSLLYTGLLCMCTCKYLCRLIHNPYNNYRAGLNHCLSLPCFLPNWFKYLLNIYNMWHMPSSCTMFQINTNGY